jgi:hypothetical protein
MPKSIEELESTACLYWPAHLHDAVAEVSSLPVLLETQNKFLSVLKCSDKSPVSWLDVIQTASTITPNLFLKHLMVLSDIGGERLQRFAKDFKQLFPNNIMEFVWRETTHTYNFSERARVWTNKKLNVEKSVLLTGKPFSHDMIDVSMILLWGSSIINNDNLPTEMRDKCVIGQLIGQPELLDEFVKQRYIIVSRITGGATVNDLGHVCEHFADKYIRANLPTKISIGGHTIPDVSHNDRDLTTFDLVATNVNTKKSVAIEISFQVTTNSVIERKAGLAMNRQHLLHEKGHKVAYIIDGSGNFQRRNAVKTILQFSDCTVNFSDSGLQELTDFIAENLTG